MSNVPVPTEVGRSGNGRGGTGQSGPGQPGPDQPGADAVGPIGVIGLGTMGGGMAGRLLDRGVRLTVHNRTAAKAAPLAEQGATVVASPADVAAAADVVLLSLADQS